jgi:hypothetical protein
MAEELLAAGGILVSHNRAACAQVKIPPHKPITERRNLQDLRESMCRRS